MVFVVMRKNHGSNVAGETCAFPEAEAAQLIVAGLADPARDSFIEPGIPDLATYQRQGNRASTYAAFVEAKRAEAKANPKLPPLSDAVSKEVAAAEDAAFLEAKAPDAPPMHKAETGQGRARKGR